MGEVIGRNWRARMIRPVEHQEVQVPAKEERELGAHSRNWSKKQARRIPILYLPVLSYLLSSKTSGRRSQLNFDELKQLFQEEWECSLCSLLANSFEPCLDR